MPFPPRVPAAALGAPETGRILHPASTLTPSPVAAPLSPLVRRTRNALRALGVFGASLATITCADINAPSPRVARVSLAPVLSVRAAEAYTEFVNTGLAINNVRVVLTRPNSADTLADTVLASLTQGQLNGDEDITIQIRVTLRRTPEQLAATVLMRSDEVVVLRGDRLIVAGGQGETPTIDMLPVVGLDTRKVMILPGDVTIRADGSVPLSGIALDADGGVVETLPQACLGWHVDDATLGSIPLRGGAFVGLGKRGVAKVILKTCALPNGVGVLADTALVTLTGVPATMTALSATSQAGLVGQLVGDPPSVVVKGTDGLPVTDVTVQFTVFSGGGSLSNAIQVTDNDGIATVGGWTLGTLVGAQTVRASAGDLQVVFTASAARFETQLALRTEPGSGPSGVLFAPQPVVELRGANGDLAVNGSAPVTVSIASGAGVLGGILTVNAVGGVATFSNLAIVGSGMHTLQFTSPGLTSVVSAAFLVGQAATTRFCPTASGAFSSLASAVSATLPEGTVFVCDGVHPVADVGIGNKAITIRAEGPGIPILDGSASTNHILSISSPVATTAAVTIRSIGFVGFTKHGVVVNGNYGKVLVDSGFFIPSHSGVYGGPQTFFAGVSAFDATGGGIVVSNSSFTAGDIGVHSNGADSIEVAHNVFSSQSNAAVHLGTAGALVGRKVIVLHGNTVSGCGAGVCAMLAGFQQLRADSNVIGILPEQPVSEAFHVEGMNAIVRNNTVIGLGVPTDRMQVSGYAVGRAFNLYRLASGLVDSNTVANAWSAVWFDSTTATVRDNFFSMLNNAAGGWGPSRGSVATMTRNDIEDYIYGLDNTVGTFSFASADFSCNWWGSPFGPHTMGTGFTTSFYVPFATQTVAQNPQAACDGSPLVLSKAAGDLQRGPVGVPLAIPPSVTVRDAQGLPISGVEVRFVVISGGGSILSPTQFTDATGTATAGLWTLGSAGANVLAARIDGPVEVQFTATVLP
jgi:hypothetical protein